MVLNFVYGIAMRRRSSENHDNTNMTKRYGVHLDMTINLADSFLFEDALNEALDRIQQQEVMYSNNVKIFQLFREFFFHFLEVFPS